MMNNPSSQGMMVVKGLSIPGLLKMNILPTPIHQDHSRSNLPSVNVRLAAIPNGVPTPQNYSTSMELRNQSYKTGFKRIYNHLNPFPYDSFIYGSA